LALARSNGPIARLTGAPGDNQLACTQCHSGALNSGKGSVRVVFPDGAQYKGGATYRLKVELRDPDQQRWGFQLTARLASNLEKGQAGDFTVTDGNTRIICENNTAKPCPAGQQVQFIEHVVAGTRPGTTGGADFEFDWTAPPAGSGPVTFYVAGNAANNNGNNQGDSIYTSSLSIKESTGAPALVVPPSAYAVRHLVSDLSGGWGDRVDPNLKNPWGISMSPTGAFWVSNAGTDTVTLYNTAGEPFPLASPIIVKIPNGPGRSGPARPTGQVWNGTEGFEITAGKPAGFIFATESGAISAWRSDIDRSNATLMVDMPGAVYKGLATGNAESGPMLFAANFSQGRIDAFDYMFKPATTPGGFLDPNLPAGFAPFNIQRFGKRLFVAYAKQNSGKTGDQPGDGNGYVNVFDLNGKLWQRLISGGALNSPWGMAMAPGFFGDFSNTLLVGNFGNGQINAFDIVSGQWVGKLAYSDANPVALEGLWGITFGNGRSGGDAHVLYFTAGVSGGGAKEDHGVFGSITVQ
jgi:uncharacterized protein (TIGR03118 family)